MELKNRKLISNAKYVLPKFEDGTEMNFASANIPTVGYISPAQAFQEDIIKQNSLFKGDLFKYTPVKSSPNLGGLMNKGAGAINAIGAGIGMIQSFSDAGKTSINANNLIGSAGTNTESSNGLSTEVINQADYRAAEQQASAERSAAVTNSMAKGAAFGSAVGSVIPGLGTAVGGAVGSVVGLVGGLFGSRKAKREAERQMMIAQNITNALNADRRTDTQAKAMQMYADQEYGNQGRQSLFHAAEGKEGAVNPITNETYKKHIVNTAYGKIKAPQNAWVSKGEVIRSEDGTLYKVKEGKNDTARAYLQDGDSVYSKKIINPETGNKVADDVEMYANAGQLDRLDMNQNIGRSLKYLKQVKNRALPGFADGEENFIDRWISNSTKGLGGIYGDIVNPVSGVSAVPYRIPEEDVFDNLTVKGSAPNKVNTTPGTTGKRKIDWFGKLKGALGSLKGGNIDLENIIPTISGLGIANKQYAEASGPIRTPNIYTSNAYENLALDKLAGLKSDYYPIWSQLREQEGRGKNAILQSGGLGAGQRALAFMGLANQTQQNGMNALFEQQNRQNALDAQWANAALQAGAQTAARQMQANQFNEDMLAKAHAAQLQGKQLAMYNAQNALEQYFANRFKKNQFKQTMKLYQDDKDVEADDLQAILNKFTKRGNKTTKK